MLSAPWSFNHSIAAGALYMQPMAFMNVKSRWMFENTYILFTSGIWKLLKILFSLNMQEHYVLWCDLNA